VSIGNTDGPDEQIERFKRASRTQVELKQMRHKTQEIAVKYYFKGTTFYFKRRMHMQSAGGSKTTNSELMK